MISVASAVEQIIRVSDFALEGLETGSLNLSVYADMIKTDVEKLAKKPVQKGSIVVALSRLGRQYKKQSPKETFKLYNLVSRTGLTELAYIKNAGLQLNLSSLQNHPDIQNAQFFVSMSGLSEISIITHTELIPVIKHHLINEQPSIEINKLASLTMQVGKETVDTPRQSYTVIKQLALRDITIVEYVTSPTELTIILYDRDLKIAFDILYDKFFKSDS